MTATLGRVQKQKRVRKLGNTLPSCLILDGGDEVIPPDVLYIYIQPASFVLGGQVDDIEAQSPAWNSGQIYDRNKAATTQQHNNTPTPSLDCGCIYLCIYESGVSQMMCQARPGRRGGGYGGGGGGGRGGAWKQILLKCNRGVNKVWYSYGACIYLNTCP